MRLKLLMVPFSILMVLIIMIAFVKPDISDLTEKKAIYATKLDQEKNMDTLLQHVDTLTSFLDGQHEKEQFLENYFPKAIDEGRVIDAFNYSASQSGVVVSTMNLNEIAMVDVPSNIPVDAGASEMPASVQALHPKVRSFSARVTVKGHYENIKDFFVQVAHMNRMHKTWNFSIATQDKKETDKPVADEQGILLGYFEAAFEYFDTQTAQNALYVPIFAKGSFDVEPLDATSRWVTNSVPPLEKPDSGRPNPFQ